MTCNEARNWRKLPEVIYPRLFWKQQPLLRRKKRQNCEWRPLIMPGRHRGLVHSRFKMELQADPCTELVNWETGWTKTRRSSYISLGEMVFIAKYLHHCGFDVSPNGPNCTFLSEQSEYVIFHCTQFIGESRLGNLVNVVTGRHTLIEKILRLVDNSIMANPTLMGVPNKL